MWFDKWVLDFEFYVGFSFRFVACCLMGCGLLVAHGHCGSGGVDFEVDL